MRELLVLIKPHKWIFSLALVLLVIASIFNSAMTAASKPMIDQVLSEPGQAAEPEGEESPSQIDRIFKQTEVLNSINEWIESHNLSPDFLKDTAELDINNPLPWALMVLIIFTLQSIFTFTGSYLMGYVGLRIVVNMRQDLIEKVMSLSLRFFESMSSGDILARINTDVLRVQNAISMRMGEFVREFTNIVAFTILAFLINWRLSMGLFVILPLVGLPLNELSRKIRKYAGRSQGFLGNLTAHFKEVLVGIRIVKGFGKEQFEAEELARENRHFLKYALRELRVVVLTPPVISFFGILVILSFVIYGSLMIQKGTMSQGDFIAYVLVIYSLYQPVKRIARVNAEVQQAVGVLPRINEILDRENDILEPAEPKRFEHYPVPSEIQFENVRLTYGDPERDPWVLKGVDFKVKQGDVVALVGPSGGGKTSLVNMIPRFYDATEGAVRIDGLDIREMSKNDLRNLIAIVTQDTILFNDSVHRNIAYGLTDVPRERVIEAAKQAHAHDFIMSLPKGYDTCVGESGDRLSGGQRQRLSIARAILKDAPILILDEATSALDTESEREVQAALDYLMQHKTTFVIAHRLSTIRRATQILVMDQGRIVEWGSHEDLMNQKKLYHKLIRMQEEGHHAL